MLELHDNLEIDVYETEEFCPINRGQIRFVDFGEVDPATRDLGKCRPAIVVQSDEYNALPDSKVAVMPLSKSPMYSCYTDKLIGVRIHGNNYPSILCTNEFTFVRKDAVREYICKCPQQVMDMIGEYLANRLCISASTEPAEEKINSGLPGDELANTDVYKQYILYAEKIIASKEVINPDWVRTLSVAECKNFAMVAQVLGSAYFMTSNKFNDKTFSAAVKTAKTRGETTIVPLSLNDFGEEKFVV